METAMTSGPARGFDDIPVIGIPEDFPDVMPELLARMYYEHGPIFRRRLPPQMEDRFGDWFVYMVGPEANRFVMHTYRHCFSHDSGWTPALGPLMEKGLLNTDDPEHAWQRKMMNPAFAIAYMGKYLPLMERVIRERSVDWIERGEVDLYDESRRITFDVAAEALVGIRAGTEVDRLGDLFFQMLHGSADPMNETMEEFWQRITSARAELDGMLLRLIAERRKAPTDDILGMLVAARDEEGKEFTDRELLGQVHILLVAGHETTTVMNAWLLYLLATHPGYLRRVHAELDAVLAETGGALELKAIRAMRVLGNALDEAGRLYSPVGVVPRGVSQDIGFGGYHLPVGTQLRLGLAACHRLPHIFENPESFDPDRFAPPREEAKRHPYALVTFGGGPRVCIGMSFAQVEMKAAVAHILRRYTLEPVADRPITHQYFGVTASIHSGIHVRVRPRQ